MLQVAMRLTDCAWHQTMRSYSHYMNSITAMITQITDSVFFYEQYEKLFSDENQFHMLLADVYLDILMFLRKARKVCEGTGMVRLGSTILELKYWLILKLFVSLSGARGKVLRLTSARRFKAFLVTSHFSKLRQRCVTGNMWNCIYNNRLLIKKTQAMSYKTLWYGPRTKNSMIKMVSASSSS